MAHFLVEDWVDFARQTIEPERGAMMQKHLSEGCESCSRNLAIWRQFVGFAKDENRFEPSASSVRIVKAGFGEMKALGSRNQKMEIASLVFDSAEQPLPAGVRGSAFSPRQLLYKSGTVCIDMRIQPKLGSDSVVLMGQLMESKKPVHGLGGVAVSLISDHATVSRKETNTDGEFDFGFQALPDLQLVFAIAKRKKLVVQLPEAPKLEH